MKKSKFLTAIIITIIFVQLFAYASLTQVKGDLTAPVTANDPQNNCLLTFTRCIDGYWQGICNWLGWHSGCNSIEAITIAPATATIAAGQSQLYSATAYNQKGNSWIISTNPDTVWSISSGAGTYVWTGSSVQVTKAGTWTVTATYKGKSDTASLTVTHASLNELAGITVSVNPTIVAAPNRVVGTATAYDIYGNSWDVSTLATWSIPAGNDGGSWVQNVYTSHTAGTYTVQAAYEGKTATTSLTVAHSTNEAQLASLAINPSTSTIAAGSTQPYTATATDSFGNSWDVTAGISASNGWSISSGAGGSWSGATYTSEKAGEWTVTGTYLDKTATATLTVTHATDEAHLAYITASMNPTSVATSNTSTGTATAYDSFGNSWDISTVASWSIPAGGDGGSWSQNVYTSFLAGAYIVQASYEGKTATTSLVVTHATSTNNLDHIVIEPSQSTVNVGVSQSYTATAYDTFGNSWSITAVYSCVNSNVVVSGNSVYSNVDGSYTITGTYDGKSDTATLNVVGHLLTIVSIAVSPKTASISAGNSQAFTATASDGYNTWDVTSTVTWSINTTAGGSWDQSTGMYTSAAAGTWMVKATLGTLSDTATLTVNANSALPSSIIISPTTSTIAAGTSQNYTVTAYDQYGNSLGDVTSSTTFNAPGASVTENSVTSNNVGSYTVTATYSGLTDAASLTVTGYTVTFTENGLQTGTSWNITFGGQEYSSLTDTIAINDVSALSYSWTTSNNIQNGQTRYLAAQTSGSLSIPSQLTQNIDYSTQYLVTYSSIGNALSVSVPTAEWVNTGAQADGSFPTQVINEAQDTRCNFLSDNRPETITQPTIIIGTYQTQYYLTVTSPYNTASGAGWYNAGNAATASLESGTASGSVGTQYVFTAWSGDASGSSLTSNNIIMNSPETATATWTTQYYLTVSSPYGSPSGAGWYNSGSLATARLSSGKVSGSKGVQYVFNDWSGDASEAALTCSVLMTSPETATASWNTQYLVTYAAVGNALPITVPSNEWVNYGAAARGKFLPTVVDSADDTQCLFLSDNRTQSITQPTTITGEYQSQYKVTFNQIGILSDTKGTVVTILSTPECCSQLANVTWVNNGTQLTFIFKASVASTTANKMYILKGVNAVSPMIIDKPTVIQGTYQAQYSTSLYTVLEFAIIIFIILLTIAALLSYRGRKNKNERSLSTTA